MLAAVAIGVAAVGTLLIGVLPWIAANLAQGIENAACLADGKTGL